MGLAERRAIKAFEETQFPRLKAAIEAAAGFAVPIEVSWDTLVVDDQAHNYGEWEKVFFEPVIGAFKAIAIDDMGKKALKEHVKKVVFKNTGGHYYAEQATSFADGVITIDHDLSNTDQVPERTAHLTKVLEKAL